MNHATVSGWARRALGFSLFALGAAALPACGGLKPTPLDARVAAQVVVTKNEPPAGCSFLGAVKGSSYVGELGDAHTDVIRNAILRGGNFVSVDIVERPVVVALGAYVVQGRLFSCPSAAGQAVAGAPVAPVKQATREEPKLACEPGCGDGFACEHGVCVAACNPLCGTGEACGIDHACHAADAALGSR